MLRGVQWENPRAWLYRVASRLATDDYRRRRLLTWLPLISAVPDPSPGVEAGLAERECVRQALEQMALKYRVPLVLYTSEGYSMSEIAQMLGLSRSAVKMRLSRGREMFRRAYQAAEQIPLLDGEPVLGSAGARVCRRMGDD
jgi:RNA polymerase sigma factor (sigma-70 family)